MGFFDKYLSFLMDDTGSNEPTRSYHEIEKELDGKTIDERKKIARAKKIAPEVLDVLADDKDVGVRRAVADNKANSGQTNLKLAQDKDDDVRLILAKRLTRLLPHLTPDEQSEIYALTVEALKILAEDHVTNIRVALSSSLKDIAKIPPQVARKLAEDIEAEVAGPILRFGIALPDDVLLSIIKSQPLGWKVKTIAERKKLSAPLSRTIIDSNNAEAGTALINNDGADIPQDLATRIVEKSKSLPEWDRAMVERRALPRKMKRKLSIMVDNAVRKFLKNNTRLGKDTAHDVIDAVRRRVDWAEDGANETPKEKIKRLIKEKKLNEESILDALSWGEYEFVDIALAVMGRVNPEIAKKMLDMKSAKATVSLCWRAGLTMRTAIKVQQQVSKIPHKEVLLARGGADYPLSDKDMIWQLEFFGIDVKG